LKNGILIIDKPQGITSHDVVRQVRRLLHMRRVGHTGTLDPLATGVLPIAVGEGTRLVEFLMAGDKTYRATLKLGERTDTQDSEGTVLERRPLGTVSPRSIEEACRSLVGTIRQIPPMYSALKKDGVPLYKLARQGIEVERAAREVQILRLDLLAVNLPYLTIEVDCSKGTYIRTLCQDLGEILGPGAHLTALRRVRTGSFGEEDAISLDALAGIGEGEKIPGFFTLEEALRDYSRLEVNIEATRRLADGVPPQVSGVIGSLPEEGKTVCLMAEGNLVAVARFAPERLKEKRGDFELLRVFHRQNNAD
jgi:tRNA pseudouridine55 synthase